MVRRLFIVSRAHPDLYVSMCDRFSGREDVAVILDRRVGERRSRNVAVRSERRVGDRRTRARIDAQLTEQSHIIVIIDDVTAPGEY